MATKTANPYASNDTPPMATVRSIFIYYPIIKRQVRLADPVYVETSSVLKLQINAHMAHPREICFENLIIINTFFSNGLQQLNITNNYGMFTTFLGTK